MRIIPDIRAKRDSESKFDVTRFKVLTCRPVSYTHLDVYKRQVKHMWLLPFRLKMKKKYWDAG